MAPRANWKGFLRLSLVTCPVALYPATSESEKVSFNQLNKQTGHRIKYVKVDADTGDEVPNEDIVKGFALDRTRSSRSARKSSRKPITPKERPRGENVVDLMEALRRSVGGASAGPRLRRSRPRRRRRRPGRRRC